MTSRRPPRPRAEDTFPPRGKKLLDPHGVTWTVVESNDGWGTLAAGDLRRTLRVERIAEWVRL